MAISPQDRNAFIAYAKQGNFALDWYTHEKILNALEPDSTEGRRYIRWVRDNLGGLPSFTAPLPISADVIDGLANGDATRQAILESVIDAAAPVWKQAVAVAKSATALHVVGQMETDASESDLRYGRAADIAKTDAKKLATHALEHGIALNAFELEGMLLHLGEHGGARAISALHNAVPEQIELSSRNDEMYALGKPLLLTAAQVAGVKQQLGDVLFARTVEGVVAGHNRYVNAQQAQQQAQQGFAGGVVRNGGEIEIG